MAMRDFTSETKQQLLKTVDEVSVPANDAWYKRFADWFDDNNFSGTHALYLQEYENGFISFKDYQQNLLDWNNTSRQDIEKIWSDINADNATYTSRLSAVRTDMNGLIIAVKKLADTIDPSAGSFTPSNIVSLKGSIQSYLKTSEKLQKLTEEGLTAEDLSKMSSQEKKDLLDGLLETWMPTVNPSNAAGTWSMSIGPSLTLTYTVTVTADKNSPVNITANINEQKNQLQALKNLKFGNTTLGFDSSNNPTGSTSVSSGSGIGLGSGWQYSSSSNLSTNGEVSGSWTHSYRNNKYTVIMGTNLKKMSMFAGYRISTDIGKSNISSEVKLEAGIFDHGWGHIAVPKKPEPVRIHLPEINWKKVAIVVGVGVVFVLAVGTVLLLSKNPEAAVGTGKTLISIMTRLLAYA